MQEVVDETFDNCQNIISMITEQNAKLEPEALFYLLKFALSIQNSNS